MRAAHKLPTPPLGCVKLYKDYPLSHIEIHRVHFPSNNNLTVGRLLVHSIFSIFGFGTINFGVVLVVLPYQFDSVIAPFFGYCSLHYSILPIHWRLLSQRDLADLVFFD